MSLIRKGLLIYRQLLFPHGRESPKQSQTNGPFDEFQYCMQPVQKFYKYTAVSFSLQAPYQFQSEMKSSPLTGQLFQMIYSGELSGFQSCGQGKQQ
ncbi:hypothetical protein FGO68_gene1937 [Halteria grandinella]|uniref:Uncharacterized protein n=1 Tax=Halteria grandinella TaxID=5974 RepID=A0A8J8NZ47_HALGN|nr:hypothetical protein FGO68_gene1937 [Halteria grandinella]